MNNEEVSRLVDNLKEINEELEKMNKNFQKTSLNSIKLLVD